MQSLSQIIAVTSVTLRSIRQRLGSSLVAIIGIAGVVIVFTAVLSIAEGFKAAMSEKGDPLRVLILRSGADTEMTSGFGGDTVRTIQDAPGIERSPEGPVASPELWAREYLRTVVLPVPAPAVAPGEMVVGWEAFLEVGSVLEHRIDEPDTPFGTATFLLTSTVTVDWGDGEVTGPVATVGGPHPDGDLRHTYIRQGAYDVVVTQAWVATWQVGGESGTVTGLVTEAVLAGFPVQEIEAVIVG